ncbi:TylF/MycF/NovP-related O-methyltransferase [Methylomonas sp. MK1]|uniref:TylF/MycF/NovP-related O-methyltransferase n=1 Tax=Methylomonas sp. MK1 TaxID=1131552 RepID=UPI00190F44A8|nr:TylF/MycF/NovP-related O-methyltransferase [Methylomonas sp. MK1]
MAHAELFKQTLNVPGDIAEFGVFRGLSLMTWANLLETYAIGDRTKVVYGFDNWQGFTGFSSEDGQLTPEVNKVFGGYDSSGFKSELEAALAIFDADRFVTWKPRVKLINGDITDSVPRFVADNPGVRFSLVHFDCDLYAPTKAALTAIWPKVSRGGLVLFDEYALKEWQGESQAVDEFFVNQPEVKLRTLEWTNSPAAYLIKP